MHRFTVVRLLGALETERATRVFQTAREAQTACRRAIEPIVGGAQVRAKVRDHADQPWTRLRSHEAERAWKSPYGSWPSRISFRLRRTIRLAANDPATEELRLTIEPADQHALAWQPFVDEEEEET
jgi:hypothetical protein